MTGCRWVLELPPGLELLTANQRPHWAVRARRTKALREAAAWMARAARVPALGHVHVLAEYRPPDRRRRDPANWQPSFKAAVDGLVDAGIVADDDAAHLTGPDPRLGPVTPCGQIVLTITATEGAPQWPM